jgi:hypothetical protein
MNFKSILVLGLSVATLGLTLPAHADTANVIKNTQESNINGSFNTTTLNNRTSIRNSQSGRRSLGNTGTTVDSDQFSSVKGDGNRTRIDNSTDVVNQQRRTPR